MGRDMDVAFAVENSIFTVSPYTLFRAGQYWFVFGRLWMNAGEVGHGATSNMSQKERYKNNV